MGVSVGVAGWSLRSFTGPDRITHRSTYFTNLCQINQMDVRYKTTNEYLLCNCVIVHYILKFQFWNQISNISKFVFCFDILAIWWTSHILLGPQWLPILVIFSGILLISLLTTYLHRGTFISASCDKVPCLQYSM